MTLSSTTGVQRTPQSTATRESGVSQAQATTYAAGLAVGSTSTASSENTSAIAAQNDFLQKITFTNALLSAILMTLADITGKYHNPADFVE
jgi:hypothetical protein